MLIVLEGNECNFKTTVAEKVSEKLNIPIVKGSSFEFSKCTNEELFQRFIELSKLDNVIIDRFTYSNRVYATLYEDYSILTDEQRATIEDLIKYKATVYYLFADDEVIKDRIAKRGDEYVDINMVAKINKEYSHVMMDTTLKVESFDTNEWNSDEISEEIAQDYTYDNNR